MKSQIFIIFTPKKMHYQPYKKAPIQQVEIQRRTHQGGIKCGNWGTGFLDSEGSYRQQRPQTCAVLSRNCICCDLRAFSGVIFPSFDGNSNMFATFTEQKSYRLNRKAIDRAENLSKDQKSYRWNRKAFDRSEWLSIE